MLPQVDYELNPHRRRGGQERFPSSVVSAPPTSRRALALQSIYCMMQSAASSVNEFTGTTWQQSVSRCIKVSVSGANSGKPEHTVALESQVATQSVCAAP